MAYEKYIGDGVYVSFDGYYVNIAVNNHENHVVALEPEVVNALKEYFKWINTPKKCIKSPTGDHEYILSPDSFEEPYCKYCYKEN